MLGFIQLVVRRSLAMPVGRNLKAELGRFAADCSADARADVECTQCWLQLASWIQAPPVGRLYHVAVIRAPEMAQGKMRLLWV